MFLNNESFVVLRLVVAVLAAALGALVAVTLKKVSHFGLCVLISFAAGALLGVTLLHLIPEAVEISGLIAGAISVASGYLLFFFLTRFVYHVCPACSATHTEIKFRAITISMILALSIHSFMDGLAIYSGALSGSAMGFAVLLAVALHKFPEGMALSLVASNSGMSRPAAFLLSFGVEAVTTIAGGLAGTLFHFSDHVSWVGLVLGHVGGGFIFLVIHALLSEVVKHHPRHTIFAALSGAVSIWLVQWVSGSAH